MGDKALSLCITVEAWPAFAFRHRWSHEHVDTLLGWWWPSSSGKELLAGFWVLDVPVDTSPWET